jgi:hypothetical protein
MTAPLNKTSAVMRRSCVGYALAERDIPDFVALPLPLCVAPPSGLTTEAECGLTAELLGVAQRDGVWRWPVAAGDVPVEHAVPAAAAVAGGRSRARGAAGSGGNHRRAGHSVAPVVPDPALGVAGPVPPVADLQRQTLATWLASYPETHSSLYCPLLHEAMRSEHSMEGRRLWPLILGAEYTVLTEMYRDAFAGIGHNATRRCADLTDAHIEDLEQERLLDLPANGMMAAIEVETSRWSRPGRARAGTRAK